MIIVYIGLGSNLGGDHASPKQNIVSAIDALGGIQSTQMISVSSLYESKPVGPQDQGNYINAVVKLETNLDAIELLDNLQAIENAHGRERKQHWGPRTLDLDILLFSDQVILISIACFMWYNTFKSNFTANKLANKIFMGQG